MRKCLFAMMILLFISFSLFIGPTEKMAQHSFHITDEPVILTVDKITNTDVVIQTIQTSIQKSQIETLFPSTDSTSILKGKLVSFRLINYMHLSKESTGFINVVQHQSNYLPT